MLALHVFELLLHTMSIITSTIVILKIIIYDKLGIITKFCICLIYSSAYVTDTSYSYTVYSKGMNSQLFLNYEQIVTPEMTPFRQATFFHEIGTWIYVWGVLLTATERVLNGRFQIDLGCSPKLGMMTPLIIFVIGFSSYYCTAALLSNKYQQLAGGIIISSQIFGIAALLYTLYLNQRRYKFGVGERLEQRYRSAYVYRFNCSLLKSLLGEVTCRLLAFSCIVAITTGIYDQPRFGWLTFIYLNLIPAGNIAFPWYIVLRHMKITCGRRQNVVKDLSGNDLVMNETADEHFSALSKAWNIEIASRK